MKVETKQKLKSTVFWSALGSAFIMFLQSVLTLFDIEMSFQTTGTLISALNSFISILAVAGVLVNTKEAEAFKTMVVKKKRD